MENIFYRVLAILFGIVILFEGRRLFFKAIPLLGFLLGALLGLVIAISTGPSIILSILYVVIGGIVGSFLFSIASWIALIVLGGFGGWSLATLLFSWVPDIPMKVLSVVLALMGIALAFFLKNFIVTVATSLLGAVMMTSGILLIPPLELSFQQPARVYLYIIILTVIGVLVQSSTKVSK